MTPLRRLSMLQAGGMVDPHLKYLVKNAIGSVFNRHTTGNQPPIGLFASRRSGTTLVSQLLGQVPRLKHIGEPLSVFAADLTQKPRLPVYAGGLIYDPAPHELVSILDYLRDIRDGRLHVAEPWRLWSRDFHFRTDRVLLKFTDAHALIDILPSALPLVPIVLFRHPAPQALSCMARNWGARDGGFFRQSDYLSTYFNADQIAYIRNAERSGSHFKRLVICWAAENAPLFSAAMRTRSVPFFTYEWLVSDPEAASRFIFETLGLSFAPRMLEVMRKPSNSSRRAETGSEIGTLLARGAASDILTRWQDRLTAGQHRDLAEVAERLGLGPYSADAPMPKALGSPHMFDRWGGRGDDRLTRLPAFPLEEVE